MTTIVTAYFKIPSKTNDETYKTWMKNMLIINNPMTIFTDIYSYDYIYELRKDKINITNIIVIDIKDFYCYKYYDTFVEQHKLDHELNVGHSVELYMVWCEKSHFLKRTILNNIFNTEYFLWVDIGCFREQNTLFINWPDINKMKIIPVNKVLLCEVYDFSEEELKCNSLEQLPDFRFINRLGGTIFGGKAEPLLLWHDKYYEMVEYFINVNKLIIKDQSIMNCVFLMNRELCFLQNPHSYHWFYLQDFLQ
jgi:hypothetical protein